MSLSPSGASFIRSLRCDRPTSPANRSARQTAIWRFRRNLGLRVLPTCDPRRDALNLSCYPWANRALAVGFLLMLAAPLALRVSADGERVLLPGGFGVPELCLYKRTTGFDCRSCHLGRSVVLAAHGQLESSLNHHRGGVLLLAWIGVQAAARLILSFTGAFLAPFWRWDLTVSVASLIAVGVAIPVIGG